MRIDWLKEAITRLEKVPMILTTRYHCDPASVMRRAKVLRMVPLRWWVVDQYVTGYFKDSPDGLQRASEVRMAFRSSPSLRPLAQNPLLLALCCFLRAEDDSSPLPLTKTGLLESAIKALFRRHDKRLGIREQRLLRNQRKLEVLGELAWHFMDERARPMPEAELLRVIEQELRKHEPLLETSADKLLQEFIEDGVLVRRGSGPCNFLLRRFHEFCLADRIARRFRDAHTDRDTQVAVYAGRAKAWGRENDWGKIRPFNQNGWSEVWPLVAGCLGESDALIDALCIEWEAGEDIHDDRLRRLALTLGEYLAVHRDRLALCRRYQTLAERVSDAVLDLASTETLTTENDVGWRATLAKLPTDLVLRKLTERIHSESLSTPTKSSYALAIGELGTKEACEVLSLLVRNNDVEELIRAEAAVGLGLVGDGAARDVLLELLQGPKGQPKKYLLFGIIVGLSYIADEKSRRALADLIHAPKTDAEARWQCLEACERLFGPEIEKELLQFAEKICRAKQPKSRKGQDSIQTLEKCIRILGSIGGPDTAAHLAKLLSLPLPPSVKYRITDAIAQTGEDSGRILLRRFAASQKTYGELSTMAALSLIRVADEELLPQILKTASDSNLEHLRFEATKACRESFVEQTLKFLVERLQDESSRVQVKAAECLGYRGGPAARAALKQAVLGSLPADAHFECMRSLGLNNDGDALKFLLIVLSDKTDDQRRRCLAAQTLGQVNCGPARIALRHVTEDETDSKVVRQSCRNALRKIQRFYGWRLLRSGLWEAP